MASVVGWVTSCGFNCHRALTIRLYCADTNNAHCPQGPSYITDTHPACNNISYLCGAGQDCLLTPCSASPSLQWHCRHLHLCGVGRGCRDRHFAVPHLLCLSGLLVLWSQYGPTSLPLTASRGMDVKDCVTSPWHLCSLSASSSTLEIRTLVIWHIETNDWFYNWSSDNQWSSHTLN